VQDNYQWNNNTFQPVMSQSADPSKAGNKATPVKPSSGAYTQMPKEVFAMDDGLDDSF
jgi:hypothetical protein